MARPGNTMDEEESRGRSLPSDRNGLSNYFSHEDSTEHAEMAASRLDVLKTKAESRALAETINVWILELPIKAANDILIVCKDQIPDGDSVDLQHLRRFAKANLLPAYLQPPESRASSIDSRSSTASSSTSGSKSSSRSRSRMRRRRSSAGSTLHLLVCPTSVISYDELSTLLLSQSPFANEAYPLRLREITVPLLAPTSVEQAQQWTAQYWPTMYRKTNPFGPHPSLVTRSEDEIRDEAGKFIILAHRAAADASSKRFGIGIGCVIVERKADRSAEIVAIASDARLSAVDQERMATTPCIGNTACHAAMRAIGMVARKRVRVATPKTPREGSATGTNANPSIGPDDLLVKPVRHVGNTPESISESLVDYPITDLERSAFDRDNLIANGYLCVDLEIYMTHEPCLMCSMAIVHSRFARCIFSHRMPRTGGMAGDAGLGYGLFWRSELNWKLLCWEYSSATTDVQKDQVHQDTQV